MHETLTLTSAASKEPDGIESAALREEAWTGEPFLRSDPEIAILRLHDRLNRVLWQPVFRQPRLVTKLFERPAWIESRSASAGEEQKECGNSEVS